MFGNINNKRQAIIWMAINCFFGTCTNVLVKIISQDLIVPVIVMGYNIGCTIIISILLLIFRTSLYTKNLHLHFYRAAFCAIAFLIYFSALKTISIANAVSITFVDPMLTCLFAYLILKDKMEKENLIGLIAGFAGALLIIKPGTGLFQVNSLIILISTFFWALSNIVMKLLTKSENSLVQIFYVSFFTAIICGFALYFGGYEISFPHTQSIGLVMLTSLTALVQYYAIYRAFFGADASEIMPFFFLNIIFSEIFGRFLFEETHDIYETIGITIIIVTNFYLLMRARKARKHR